MPIPPSPLSDSLSPGVRLQHGALTIMQVLAHSNFAITYTARDENLRREVAVKEFFPFGCRRDLEGKVVPPPISAIEDFTLARTQFLEEARILAQFHHPGVVAVHAFFEANNTAYMVMELLHGSTLLEQLEARGYFPENEVLRLARQIGETLQAVHDAGLLHRDLKPDNIFACDDGRLVLLDFGLSTRLETDHYGTRRLDSLTRFGTPGYAPPEQYVRNTTQNAAADVYSFGATLYHLLTGMTPPPAPERAFGAKLDAPCRVIAGVSPPVSNAILRALRLKPQQRPQSVRAFVELLNVRDDFMSARNAFLGTLRARMRQIERIKKLEHQSLAAPAQNLRPIAPVGTQKLGTQKLDTPQSDDSGCLQFAFVAYLLWWLVALVVCCAWLFLQFFSVKW